MIATIFIRRIKVCLISLLMLGVSLTASTPSFAYQEQRFKLCNERNNTIYFSVMKYARTLSGSLWTHTTGFRHIESGECYTLRASMTDKSLGYGSDEGAFAFLLFEPSETGDGYRIIPTLSGDEDDQIAVCYPLDFKHYTLTHEQRAKAQEEDRTSCPRGYQFGVTTLGTKLVANDWAPTTHDAYYVRKADNANGRASDEPAKPVVQTNQRYTDGGQEVFEACTRYKQGSDPDRNLIKSCECLARIAEQGNDKGIYQSFLIHLRLVSFIEVAEHSDMFPDALKCFVGTENYLKHRTKTIRQGYDAEKYLKYIYERAYDELDPYDRSLPHNSQCKDLVDHAVNNIDKLDACKIRQMSASDDAVKRLHVWRLGGSYYKCRDISFQGDQVMDEKCSLIKFGQMTPQEWVLHSYAKPRGHFSDGHKFTCDAGPTGYTENALNEMIAAPASMRSHLFGTHDDEVARCKEMRFKEFFIDLD